MAQDGEGAVECTAEAGAHKCARTSHHIPVNQAFLGFPEWPAYPRHALKVWGVIPEGPDPLLNGTVLPRPEACSQ